MHAYAWGTVSVGEEYKLPIVLALALLFTFYVVSFAWITVFDWWRYGKGVV